MNIGKRIQNARKAKGITQDQLAKLLYKSKRTIEKYEANEIDLSLSTIIEISGILDISILELVVDDSDDILSIIKEYYGLEDKHGFNMEKDFEMILKGFIERYKKKS